jgi:hypothetical protein
MEPGNVQSSPEAASSQKLLSPVLRISLLLGVCLHLAGFLVFRVVSNPLATREPSLPFVQYVSPETLFSGAALEEQAELFDSAPLFVPGRWNAAHNLQPPSRDRVLLRFPPYEAEFDLSGELISEGINLSLDSSVTKPIDLLALRYWNLFSALGRTGAEAEALELTGAFAEVRTLNGVVLSLVPVDVEVLSMQATQPATYFLRVEAAGRVVGRPTLSHSSGDSAFDAAAYTWLVSSGFPADLPAGFFEIRVYP